MTPEELAIPPTEPEIGDVLRVLSGAGLSPLASVVRRLVFQRDQFRAQSAREHAGWEALRNGEVSNVEVSGWRNRKPTDFTAFNQEEPGFAYCGYDDPVDAVRAAAKAAKQEARDGASSGHGK